MHTVLRLLKTYAWLVGDGALVVFALYELYSLRSRDGRKPGEEPSTRPPPSP